MSFLTQFVRRFRYSISIILLSLSLVRSQREKKVFAHYLPWYDSTGVKYPDRTGWCYSVNGNYDCSDNSVIHYSNKPLIGEYSQFDPDVLEYHFLLMHVANIDGITININPENAMQKDASLFVLDELVAFNAKHADVNLQAIISYDDGGGQSDITITQSLTWVYDNIYNDPSYSSLIFLDPVTSNPVLLAWSESNNELYWNTIQLLFSSQVFFLIRNAQAFEYSDGNFEWVNKLNQGLPKDNTDNWGEQYFDDMDYGMAHQTSAMDQNTVKMGGVYPGFDDENVSAFWGGTTNRYHLRTVNDGETMDLTWQKQIDYQPLRFGGNVNVENPWVQIATWNDWPEGTSVEPATSDTYGYTALETNRVKIAEFKGSSAPYEAICLQVPFLIYEQRKAGEDAVADYGVEQLLEGNCLTSLEIPSPPTGLSDDIDSQDKGEPVPDSSVSPSPSPTPTPTWTPSTSPSTSSSPSLSVSPSPSSSPTPSPPPSPSPLQCVCLCPSLFGLRSRLFDRACAGQFQQFFELLGGTQLIADCNQRVESLCLRYKKMDILDTLEKFT